LYGWLQTAGKINNKGPSGGGKHLYILEGDESAIQVTHFVDLGGYEGMNDSLCMRPKVN